VPVRADTGTPSHQPCTQFSREHPANGARRVTLNVNPGKTLGQ